MHLIDVGECTVTASQPGNDFYKPAVPVSQTFSIGAWTVLAWGQQYVDSALAGVLNSTSPIFVFLITLLWTRHEPVRPPSPGPGRLCDVL